ncbi:hypothetical protein LV89_02950 [Arcicella aurantiaca]|uniref:Uncharacterized protein n=1 Tax=Arcicella aurantiaca TaxID=591202 RepID=A0A316E1D5_9BACT|nr:hypothetical protein [Arcicella aurantiaca]PWK24437.1 hypothetical protein LV89_02950 [Arcicella aurantiaca]
MKKLLLAAMLLAGLQSVNAQVFSGTQEVEKANKEGLYTSVAIDDKYVKQAWQAELAKYGKVESGKSGAYKVTGANMPTISGDPVMLVSRISSEKGRTKIFLSLGLGDEAYVGATHPKYASAEKILNDFVEVINLQEGVRVEEKNLEDVKDKQTKVIKTGDKLVRAIEDNKREKEKLLKKIEENKVELEKLLTDVEQNKKDQISAGENTNVQLKKVEEAKAKVPKQ